MELVGHGGHCCGIFHIYGMGMSPTEPGRQRGQTRAQELTSLIDEFEDDNDEALPRLLEVVIIDSQEQDGWPAELARQGFRKAFRFLNGNTGRHCNVWHWHGAARDRNARDYQVYDPNAVAPVAPVVDAVNGGRIRRGSEVRHTGGVAGARPLPELGIGVVTDDVPNGATERATVRVRWNNTGRSASYYLGNLSLAQDVVVGPQPPRQERRVVFRTYHCVYRDQRRGAGYDSENAARQANPRARQIDVREIWSDGQTAWIVGAPLPRNQG